ncbi:CTP synthase [Gossypium australe]|uniref:CTP synthase (glutamine hydrolyzing) n=1 Tax=Gossypium australe TaxID=47621 RepID=A0A5B6VDV7_9ROSI|nr:CTP synthase [Gossypium australe]
MHYFFCYKGCFRSRYGDATFVDERHRHRYEVNPDMISELEAAGMSFVGRDESGRRMEIVELPSHPFFIGVQFHPEFKSRPGKPSALFSGLIAASCGELDELLNKSSHVSKVVGSGISNGKATYNGHQNGSYFNALNGSLNGVCVNGNGVHH